ncbi:MAG TPA: 6-phosphogluconolactonase [Bacteroidota bacterium]
MMRILPDLESLSRAAAELIAEQSKIAIEAHNRFSLVLSGGKTPQRTYELLATEPCATTIQWNKVHVFWGDERCVPPDDRRSNEHAAREAFLDRVPIPTDQIHPIRCAPTPQKAVFEYESVLKAYFGNRPAAFDVVLLGLGEDGHTASLFPGSRALKEDKRWVVEGNSGKDDFQRATLTPHIINRAAMVVFLVAGKEKAKVLRQVTANDATGEPLPARLIRPSNGKLVWLVDKEAGGIMN